MASKRRISHVFRIMGYNTSARRQAPTNITVFLLFMSCRMSTVMHRRTRARRGLRSRARDLVGYHYHLSLKYVLFAFVNVSVQAHQQASPTTGYYVAVSGSTYFSQRNCAYQENLGGIDLSTTSLLSTFSNFAKCTRLDSAGFNEECTFSNGAQRASLRVGKRNTTDDLGSRAASQMFRSIW